jgi:uncharacterized protein (TIGR03437 family)
VVSYVANRICRGGSGCVFVERYESRILGRRAALPMTFTGRARVSRNGRYAVRFGSTGPRIGDTGPNLIDLETGERTTVPNFVPSGRPLASDGTIALHDGVTLRLWSRSAEHSLGAVGPVASVVLSDNAAWVAYESVQGGGRSLVLLEASTGRRTELARGAAPFSPSFSDDGRSLLYVAGAPPQAILRSTGSGQPRPLTAAPEGVREAALTGNGRMAYAATLAGRLLRIDAPTGEVTELVGRTPFLDSIAGAPAPGSLNWLRGSGLADGTAVAEGPLPLSLGGVELQLDGVPLPLLVVSPEEIRYQLPFELAPGNHTIRVLPQPSPFEQAPWNLEVRERAPQPIRFGTEIPLEGSFEAVIANADFSALVSAGNPARPGDLVHVYMTGLGPVEPAGETGRPAPLDRLFRAPLECVWYPRLGLSAPADIRFAGLAPGFVGVYQVDLRLPDLIPQEGMTYRCGGPDDVFGYVNVPATTEP